MLISYQLTTEVVERKDNPAEANRTLVGVQFRSLNDNPSEGFKVPSSLKNPQPNILSGFLQYVDNSSPEYALPFFKTVPPQKQSCRFSASFEHDF